MEINKQAIKQFVEEKGYTSIIFSPKGRKEIWDPRPPYGAPVKPFEELPHDNFVKITRYVSSGAGIGYGVSGTEKDYIEEIKEADSSFLSQLFQWATKEKVKMINTKSSVNPTNYIPGTNTPTDSKLVIEEVMIIKKTQTDYENDKRVGTEKIMKFLSSYECPYCQKKVDTLDINLNRDLDDKPREREYQKKKRCFQHLENCSFYPADLKAAVKSKEGWENFENIYNPNRNKDDNSHREREREIGEVAAIYPVDLGEVVVKSVAGAVFYCLT